MRNTLIVLAILYIFFVNIDLRHAQDNLKEYQIEVTKDGTTLYDKNRKVGFVPYTHTQLDSLIDWDNR